MQMRAHMQNVYAHLHMLCMWSPAAAAAAALMSQQRAADLRPGPREEGQLPFSFSFPPHSSLSLLSYPSTSFLFPWSLFPYYIIALLAFSFPFLLGSFLHVFPFPRPYSFLKREQTNTTKNHSLETRKPRHLTDGGGLMALNLIVA